jgi:hypothetical protein
MTADNGRSYVIVLYDYGESHSLMLIRKADAYVNIWIRLYPAKEARYVEANM